MEALDRELAMKSKYLDDLQAIQQQYILNAQLAAQNPLQNPLAGINCFSFWSDIHMLGIWKFWTNIGMWIFSGDIDTRDDGRFDESISANEYVSTWRK